MAISGQTEQHIRQFGQYHQRTKQGCIYFGQKTNVMCFYGMLTEVGVTPQNDHEQPQLPVRVCKTAFATL